MANVLDVCQRSDKFSSYAGKRWLIRCSVTAPLAKDRILRLKGLAQAKIIQKSVTLFWLIKGTGPG